MSRIPDGSSPYLRDDQVKPISVCAGSGGWREPSIKNVMEISMTMRLLGHTLTCLMLPVLLTNAGCMAEGEEPIEPEASSEAEDQPLAEAEQALVTGGVTCWFQWYDYAQDMLLTCKGTPAGDGIYSHSTWEYGFYYPYPYGYQFPAYFSGDEVNWYNCRLPNTPNASKQILVKYWVTYTNGTTSTQGQSLVNCR